MTKLANDQKQKKVLLLSEKQYLCQINEIAICFKILTFAKFASEGKFCNVLVICRYCCQGCEGDE